MYQLWWWVFYTRNVLYVTKFLQRRNYYIRCMYMVIVYNLPKAALLVRGRHVSNRHQVNSHFMLLLQYITKVTH